MQKQTFPVLGWPSVFYHSSQRQTNKYKLKNAVSQTSYIKMKMMYLESVEWSESDCCEQRQALNIYWNTLNEMQLRCIYAKI